MINIREMTKKDIPVIVSFFEDTTEDFMNQWGGGRWYKYPITAKQIESVTKTRKDNTLYFVISNDNDVIGSFELDYINWDEKKCSICRYIIKKEYRSQGYGTKVIKIIVQNAFNKLNMKKVTLSVYDFNIGAIKCYQKAGFNENGRITRENGWIAIQMEINNDSI